MQTQEVTEMTEMTGVSQFHGEPRTIIKRLSKALTKKPTRRHINGVLVENGLASIIDDNGHYYIQVPTGLDAGVAGFIPLTYMDEILVIKGQLIHIVTEEGYTPLAADDACVSAFKSARTQIGNGFEGDGITEIYFNPRFLDTFRKALDLKKGRGLKLRFKDKLSPIHVYSGAGMGEFCGLIMPMRG
jgi:hypothetical protein